MVIKNMYVKKKKKADNLEQSFPIEYSFHMYLIFQIFPKAFWQM